MIDTRVLDNAERHRNEFSHSFPFRHLAIDGFLKGDAAERLLKEFPQFEGKHALDELGRVGRKAIVENVAAISPFYAEFSKYIQSREFLDAISSITGIPGLIPDKTLAGGGAHENLNGQELDAHVDFNYDDDRWLHRRLNVLIYLNKEWEESWGGSVELHSDPRHPERNEIKSFLPLFNRVVIFETSEYSWHGFQTINVPEDKRHLSRKSFSIYLYTKDRPIEDVAAPHTTFYVQRPLPAHIKPGTALSAEDFETIQTLIHRRDSLLEFYQRLLVEKEQRMRRVLSSRSWRLLRNVQRVVKLFRKGS